MATNPATKVATKCQARSDKHVYTVSHFFASRTGSDYFVYAITNIIASCHEAVGQGSERSENALVWTAQSSHSQVWSEVMNQTDCTVNDKRTD